MVLIGIHSDPDAAKMKSAVKELKMSWAIALDADSRYMKALKCDSYPDYVLIDRKGKVRFVDLANGELDKAVELLLKEKG